MNAVREEKYNDVQEEYEYVPYCEVKKITRDLIDKHMEALKALANA